MLNQFSRTSLLIGQDGLDKLSASKVAIFGLGGVGSYIAEALARTGVGELTLVDNDVVNETNINRQIIATYKTVGQAKVEVEKQRLLEINPNIKINAYQIFFSDETDFDFLGFDYVADAIDTVSGKIELIIRCQKAEVPVISSMGTGNKLNPAMLEVSDIYKTSVCPLAKVMRQELKKRGVKHLKVVYSKELPIKIEKNTKEKLIGSVAFVPSVAGLIIASEIVKDLISKN